MTDTKTMSDEELTRRLDAWKLAPATAPLPHNADIEPASLDEWRALKAEARDRGLIPD